MTQARGGRTPSLRGEGAFPGASAAVGGTRVSLNCCGVRAACPGSRPRSPSPCGAAAEPAVPGYPGLRRRGAGQAPLAGRPGPAWVRSQPRPHPSDPPVCEREGSGWAGGGGSQRCEEPALGRFTWRCSGEAPGSLCPPQPAGQQLLGRSTGGGGGRAPDGILHLTPGRVLPGDTAGFGSALAARGAVISAVQDRQEAPGRAAEPGGTRRYPPRPVACRDPGQRRARSLPRGTRSQQRREGGSCCLPPKLLINNHPGDRSRALRPGDVLSQGRGEAPRPAGPVPRASSAAAVEAGAPNRPPGPPLGARQRPQPRPPRPPRPRFAAKIIPETAGTFLYLPLGRPSPSSSR